MKYGPDSTERQEKTAAEAEVGNKRLRKELMRVTEEQDLLKRAAVHFANQPE